MPPGRGESHPRPGRGGIGSPMHRRARRMPADPRRRRSRRRPLDAQAREQADDFLEQARTQAERLRPDAETPEPDQAATPRLFRLRRRLLRPAALAAAAVLAVSGIATGVGSDRALLCLAGNVRRPSTHGGDREGTGGGRAAAGQLHHRNGLALGDGHIRGAINSRLDYTFRLCHSHAPDQPPLRQGQHFCTRVSVGRAPARSCRACAASSRSARVTIQLRVPPSASPLAVLVRIAPATTSKR